MEIGVLGASEKSSNEGKGTIATAKKEKEGNHALKPSWEEKPGPWKIKLSGRL